jgi:hypothetical protein
MQVLSQKKPKITHTWILESIDGSRGRKERDFLSFWGSIGVITVTNVSMYGMIDG